MLLENHPFLRKFHGYKICFYKAVLWLLHNSRGVQLPFLRLLAKPHNTYATIHIYMLKHNDAITTSGASYLEKNIPLTLLKVFCVSCEMETEQRLQHIDPPSFFGLSSASFSFSWAAQPGAWGPSLSAESWFPQIDLEYWLQALNSNCLTSCPPQVISLFYVHSIQPVDSKGHPLI